MTMKKNLLLYILLAFLIIMNGIFLFKHFSDADIQDTPRRGPRVFIAKQLKFNDVQTITFEKLDADHRMKMKAILDDIRIAKDELFDKLSDTTVAEPTIDSLTSIIAKHESAKDKQTFHFFQSIRNLCNEDQKEHFESIIRDALHKPGGPDGKGPPRGPRGENRRPPPPRH